MTDVQERKDLIIKAAEALSVKPLSPFVAYALAAEADNNVYLPASAAFMAAFVSGHLKEVQPLHKGTIDQMANQVEQVFNSGKNTATLECLNIAFLNNTPTTFVLTVLMKEEDFHLMKIRVDITYNMGFVMVASYNVTGCGIASSYDMEIRNFLCKTIRSHIVPAYSAMFGVNHCAEVFINSAEITFGEQS